MDEPKREPPTPEQVLARMRCCLALTFREMAENAARELGSPPEFMPRQLADFIDAFGLREHFTGSERALVDAAFGTIDVAGQVRLIAGLDALHTLLWALKAIDDFGFGVSSLDERRGDVEAAYALSEEDAPDGGVRTPAELWDYEILGEALLWRLRLARAERQGEITAAERRDRVASILEKLQPLGGMVESVAGDLALDGRPLTAFDDGERSEAYWVILARQATLLWLLGMDTDWDRLHFLLHESERRAGLEPPRLPEPPEPPGPHCARPDERDVAARVVALTTLFLRAGIEADARRTGRSELPKSFGDRLAEFGRALSPREAELVARLPGTWSPQEYVGAVWRLEALGCLLWALGTVEEMPGYDTPFTPDLLALLKPAVGGGPFRSVAEIDRARGIAEMWHWRSRTAQLMRAGKMPPAGLTYPEILEISANAAHKHGDLGPPIDGDFPLFGKAYGALSQEEFETAHSIAIERHYAFNWLCGYAPDWDSVRTDT